MYDHREGFNVAGHEKNIGYICIALCMDVIIA
jgi:hypothetical protein